VERPAWSLHYSPGSYRYLTTSQIVKTNAARVLPPCLNGAPALFSTGAKNVLYRIFFSERHRPNNILKRTGTVGFSVSGYRKRILKDSPLEC
jgi:hypothetical protein